MAGLMEIIEDDQLLGRLSVPALKSNEFLEWLHDADIPLACENIRVLTDEAVCRVQGKAEYPSILKLPYSTNVKASCCDNGVLDKYVRFYARLLLSGPMGLLTKYLSICSCVSIVTSNAQRDT